MGNGLGPHFARYLHFRFVSDTLRFGNPLPKTHVGLGTIVPELFLKKEIVFPGKVVPRLRCVLGQEFPNLKVLLTNLKCKYRAKWGPNPFPI
jgi:hypothetical protein